MTSAILLVTSLALLSYLSIYSCFYLTLALLNAVWRSRTKPLPLKGEGAVTVLIPSHQEGFALADAVQTVINQDYPDPIRVVILVKDAQDNSVEHLLETFDRKTAAAELAIGQQVDLVESPTRQVSLRFSGHEPKKDKLNYALPQVDTPFLAILDADHRAAPEWINTSVAKLVTQNAAAVQTKRAPLGVERVSQIWDSAENHIGNEMLNTAFSELGLTVFFTGTACLFSTEVIKARGFSDNITEDTYLSCSLILEGHTIVYNSDCASFEDMSLDVKSFVARRRRWSAGHSATFFAHLLKIARAPISLAGKLQLFFHGQFFLLSLAVCLLLWAHGLFAFLQYTHSIQLLSLGVSFIISLLLTSRFSPGGIGRYCIDLLVGMLWVFPQIAILAVYIYFLRGDETYYYILSFPYSDSLSAWYMATILAPLCVIVVGAIKQRQFNRPLYYLLIPLYPIQLFFDIYASLLGLFDLLLRTSHWQMGQRSNIVSTDAVPENVQKQLSFTREVKTTLCKTFVGTAVLASAILGNDLLSTNECGQIDPFLWRPWLFKPDSRVLLDLKLSKSVDSPGKLKLHLSATVLKNEAGALKVQFAIDGKPAGGLEVDQQRQFSHTIPLSMDWNPHLLTLLVEGKGCQYKMHFPFTAVVKEVRGRQLYVNGEPFLIKGLIPSFSSARVDLPLETGLRQIHEAGANTLRFYHEIDSKVRDAAAHLSLMVIQQPNRSTWEEVDLRGKVSRLTFKRRYQLMVEASKDYPFLLLNNLGNELDLGGTNPRQRMVDTESLLLEAMAIAPTYPSSYSTYYTSKNYPVDILGINMLDTGETYWGPGLRALKYYNKPIYASEFGGFLAFHEKTPHWLRIARLGNQWRSLLSAGGIGACFFQSHDNWGQPVPTGYNDPFRPEMPDDLRGCWDVDNNPKLELRFVTQLFSDLSAKVVEETIASSAATVTIDIANIRKYQLEGVRVFGNGRLVADLGTLAVGETKCIDTKMPNKAILHLRFEYTTHHGLKSLSKLDLPLPLVNDLPRILNTDFIVERESADQITGTLLFSDRLEVVLPEAWKAFSFNGKRYERGNGRKCFTVVNPFHPVKNLRYTRDGRRNHPFEPRDIKSGRYGLSFDLPDLPAQNRQRLLIMEGLGANKLMLRYGGAEHLLKVHSYRETMVLDLNKLSSKDMEEKFVVLLDRTRHGYNDPSLSDFRNQVFVNVEHPKVFSPLHIVLKKL